MAESINPHLFFSTVFKEPQRITWLSFSRSSISVRNTFFAINICLFRRIFFFFIPTGPSRPIACWSSLHVYSRYPIPSSISRCIACPNHFRSPLIKCVTHYKLFISRGARFYFVRRGHFSMSNTATNIDLDILSNYFYGPDLHPDALAFSKRSTSVVSVPLLNGCRKSWRFLNW